MLGNQYEVFGTDTVFEITGEHNGYWVITVRSSTGEELGVSMKKEDLEDGINMGKLKKVT